MKHVFSLKKGSASVTTPTSNNETNTRFGFVKTYPTSFSGILRACLIVNQ